LAIALFNILPAYPLDGGRILQACLFSAFSNKESKPLAAQRRANSVCKAVTVMFSLIFFACFLLTRGKNVSLLLFGVFLFFGVVGNKNTHTVYEKLDFSVKTSLKKGVQIRYVAVLDSRPVKDVLPFLERGSYLVLRVYDENERHLFDLPQNEFSEWFLRAKTPYTTLKELFVTKKEYTYA
jgi:stage IV sporulation protein FB